ncbi:DUF1559 domain-containing protein [Emticicia sp. C21]|uniref:DUF1559 domain-containing protein n=1 Tax=Emticicia sp. C21 TaxID=2302915 RepID=UPI000E3508B6|nr:DUF1559 domain-containing protein [Emticicia sp. C21]RFS13932.1 DUF1559 domain-containing protein [Emticicia sp. C21]
MKKILLLLLSIVSLQVKAQFVEARTDSFKTRVPLRLMNIGEGAGKVLTSDAIGRATWQTPASGSGLWTLAGVGGNEIQNTNTGGFWSSYSTLVPYAATNITNPPIAPVAGGGTRMMWIPSRSAFRCGSVSGNAWDANNIGLHSFATGYNSWASGIGNVAIGTGAISDGTSNTIAIGENSRASTGYGNMAFGLGAISDGTSNTIAFGESAHASGDGSMAFGSFAFADGSVRAVAIGANTRASGNYSTSIGTGTIGNAYYSVALGYYNSPIGTASATNWVSTDPLLYIGNGQSAVSQSNAMVIQKNGVVNIGITPGASTTFKLRVGGNISASGLTATNTVSGFGLRSLALAGPGERPLCTDENGFLVECQTVVNTSYYNVSALGFHPILSSSTPSSVFNRVVEKALISFANNTKSADAYAFAPIELTNGALVDKMTMHFIQNTGGGMTLTFYSVEKQTNAVGTTVASIVSASGSGIQEKEVVFDKTLVIDNSKFYYYLKLEAGSDWQGTDLAFRGVVFTYRYPSRL